MQDNPFYPGYNPATAKGNQPDSPLYPGYYPGQPIERTPIPKNFIEPIGDFDPGLFSFLDTAGYVTGELTLPTWTTNRLMDDLRQQMRVAIYPDGISAERLDA